MEGEGLSPGEGPISQEEGLSPEGGAISRLLSLWAVKLFSKPITLSCDSCCCHD